MIATSQFAGELFSQRCHTLVEGRKEGTDTSVRYVSPSQRTKSCCSNLTDCIAFIYDYLIIELQLEPCGNINSLYLAAKNSNISGGGITAEGPVHTDGLLTSAVAGL
ncbi:TPA: hypothetical protein ACH3X2_005455 [Trebouxia sp. C0005]